jgi:hypothetical protein
MSSSNEGPLQLGTTEKSQRLILTAGNYSVLEVFDKTRFMGTFGDSFSRWFF